MVKDENYIAIQGFMVSQLKLKGNELIVYAIIFGFSQLKGQKFSGSLQYLADWTNSSKQGVQKNLKSLLAKKLIAKEETMINGVKFVAYYATQLYRVCNSVAWGMQLSCTNNIDNNIYIKEEEEEKENSQVIENENNPFTFYESNFGLLSSFIAMSINEYIEKDGLSAELIVAAMKDALENNAKSWKYIKTILNNCIKDKIKTVEQYKGRQIEFKNQKNTNKTTNKKEIIYNTDFSEYDEYARRE